MSDVAAVRGDRLVLECMSPEGRTRGKQLLHEIAGTWLSHRLDSSSDVADMLADAQRKVLIEETLAQLARAAFGGLVTSADAARAWRISPPAAAARLSRLAKSGWLARVRRGVYLIAPLEDVGTETTIEDPWILAHRVFLLATSEDGAPRNTGNSQSSSIPRSLLSPRPTFASAMSLSSA